MEFQANGFQNLDKIFSYNKLDFEKPQEMGIENDLGRSNASFTWDASAIVGSNYGPGSSCLGCFAQRSSPAGAPRLKPTMTSNLANGPAVSLVFVDVIS